MISEKNMGRRMARFRSLQALFQMEASGASVDKVTAEFSSDKLLSYDSPDEEYAAYDSDYFKLLLDSAMRHQKQIDRLTNLALKDGWPMQRIDPTLRALFRSAGAELMIRSVPPRVTIDEFVEIAKAFYPEGKAAGLVNGVLDRLVKELSLSSAKT